MNQFLESSLVKRISGGGVGLCLSVKISRTLDLPMLAKVSGFDSFYIDMEHSAISLETTRQLCVIGLAVGITPLIRIPGHAAHHFHHALDAGAQGVIVPHINSAAEAREVVSNCKFPPEGRRSLAHAWPQFALSPESTRVETALLNRSSLIITMLETEEAIENADSIAAVDGVNILLVGAGDLGASRNIFDEDDHPFLIHAYEKVVSACNKEGKVAGMAGIPKDPITIEKIIGMGVRFVSAGNDMGLLFTAARNRVQLLRGFEASHSALRGGAASDATGR